MRMAARLVGLGTETSFSVAERAEQWRASGHEVFPFHLGDLDLPAPRNIVAALERAIAEGRTGYCPPAGVPELRAAIAQDVGAARGIPLGSEHVVVQSGGKPVITKFIQAVMDPGDEVLYPNPGFPIYESQIEYFGGVARPYRYSPTPTGFAIDIDHLRAAVGSRTRAIIYNDLQNPMGAESTQEERMEIAAIARENDLWVLSDEAYFDTRFSGASHSIASLPDMQDRTVILFTFSKRFAMTGWRLGAAIAPEPLADVFTRLNTNDESCTTTFVQHAGVEALTGDRSGPARIIEVLQARRDAAIAALEEAPGISSHRPEVGFYLYPDVTGAMARKGFDDVDAFAEAALRATGASFCTRNHFGRRWADEDRHHVRIAFSAVPERSIAEGLGRLAEWVDAG